MSQKLESKIRLIFNNSFEPVDYTNKKIQIFTIPQISQYIWITFYILYSTHIKILHDHLTHSQIIFFHIYIYISQKLSRNTSSRENSKPTNSPTYSTIFHHHASPRSLWSSASTRPLIRPETRTPPTIHCTPVYIYIQGVRAFLGRGRDTRPRKRYTHRRLIFAHGAKPDWYSSHSRHTYSHPHHQG